MADVVALLAEDRSCAVVVFTNWRTRKAFSSFTPAGVVVNVDDVGDGELRRAIVVVRCQGARWLMGDDVRRGRRGVEVDAPFELSC